MMEVSIKGHFSSQLNPESLLTPQTTEMGSPLIKPPHPPKQQHKFTKLKANNLYVSL